MNLLNTSLALLALTCSCNAFTPLSQTRMSARTTLAMAAKSQEHDFDSSKFYFMEEKQTKAEDSVQPKKHVSTNQSAKKQPAKPKKAHGKSGVLSPAVLFVKDIWGDDAAFNKFRANVISMHADAISSFVETSNSFAGKATLKTLFQLADRDRSGTIEEGELATAFSFLGFDWLKEKQLKGIFTRADKDGNGKIDMDEWLNEAPATLRTNLIKLAKKNGGELGLLA